MKSPMASQLSIMRRIANCRACAVYEPFANFSVEGSWFVSSSREVVFPAPIGDGFDGDILPTDPQLIMESKTSSASLATCAGKYIPAKIRFARTTPNYRGNNRLKKRTRWQSPRPSAGRKGASSKALSAILRPSAKCISLSFRRDQTLAMASLCFVPQAFVQPPSSKAFPRLFLFSNNAPRKFRHG